MAILTFPAILPSNVEWMLESNTQSSPSPLNRANQCIALPGDRWKVTLTFDKLEGVNARLMRSFLASLRGRSGRFYLYPHDAPTPTGTALGTPLVKGAGQPANGNTLLTDGWTPNQAAALNIGDFFQVGSELKMVRQTLVINASGEGTIVFDSPLRASPADNAAIITSYPKAVMELPDDQQARWVVSSPVIYGFSFSCQEGLDI